MGQSTRRWLYSSAAVVAVGAAMSLAAGVGASAASLPGPHVTPQVVTAAAA